MKRAVSSNEVSNNSKMQYWRELIFKLQNSINVHKQLLIAFCEERVS
jgi:hypothetical protein